MDVIEKEFRRREGSRSPDRGPTAARGGILDNSHFYRLLAKADKMILLIFFPLRESKSQCWRKRNIAAQEVRYAGPCHAIRTSMRADSRAETAPSMCSNAAFSIILRARSKRGSSEQDTVLIPTSQCDLRPKYLHSLELSSACPTDEVIFNIPCEYNKSAISARSCNNA